MPVDEVEIYRNRLQQVTNLNTSLFQTPAILSTIIGGLWYIAAQHLHNNWLLVTGVFSFAALVGCIGMLLVLRIAVVLHHRMNDMARLEAEFHGAARPKGPSSAALMASLMFGASLLSLGGAIAAALQLF